MQHGKHCRLCVRVHRESINAVKVGIDATAPRRKLLAIAVPSTPEKRPSPRLYRS